MKPVPAALPARSHYQILDGLRGVAALMVVILHTLGAYGDGNRFKQIINHGYLAVDFFFLLSGFVIAYAYDGRWPDGKRPGMTQWEFLKRRLIRLQPLVVMGSIIGAALFYTEAAPNFPLIAHTPIWKMLLVMLIGMTLIPIRPAHDIRGGGFMYPLNSVAWSLFFEYIANILYAIGLHKLSNRALGILVAFSAAFLTQYLLFGPTGDPSGGWTLSRPQLHIGFARLFYPFFAGILLMRIGTRIRVPQAFAVCSALLILTFALPRFGGPTRLWLNGLYESVAIIVIFPLIVAIGAGDTVHSAFTLRLSKFFGELSYPLYITHYPLICLYTAWVTKDHVPAARGAFWGVILILTAFTIAYACLKLYDEPVRAWLQRRFLPTRA